MKNNRVIVVMNSLLGVVAVAVACAVCKEKLREWWYIWKLETGSEAESTAAAGKLVEVAPREAIPYLVAMLPIEGENRHLHFAAQALVNIGKPAIPALTDLLHAERPGRRELGVNILGLMREEGAGTAELLVNLLSDQDERVRSAVGYALGQMGGAGIVALREVLRTGDESKRILAVYALDQIGGAARDAIPELILALRDANKQVRWKAALALAGFGADARAAIPALTVALGDQEENVRRNAANALGYVGSGSTEALRALRDLCRNGGDESVRKIAGDALKRVEGQSTNRK